MEPGDLEALARIEAAAGRVEGEPRTLADLKRFLPCYEVFVAEVVLSEPVGFAAAAPLSSLDPEDAGGEGAEGCFWIGALRVDPARAPSGTPAALLGSVADRARWFFCRAMGVLAPSSTGGTGSWRSTPPTGRQPCASASMPNVPQAFRPVAAAS